jgi:hypothetical protein
MLGEHQFALDRDPWVIVSDKGLLETSVIINILDDLDDGFSGQPVPDRVLPRPAFAVFSGRTGTSERVAPIGFDLSERGHGLVGRSVTVEATFSETPLRSGIVATGCCAERFGAIADVGSASPSTANAMASGRACCQSLRAIGSGSIMVFCHHVASSP